MGLKEYKEKRDFAKTPEPKAQEGKAGKQGRFVVQRHDARKLHYDFRLEIGGVLKSWAVPKGPSLNPADKRLAVMTEDHPVSYLDFEGTIPKGNYGAGEMAIWDRGTFEAEEGNDLEKDIAKGRLSLILRGNRLNGRFSLVRMEKGGDASQWLLIKKKDAFSVEEAYDPELIGQPTPHPSADLSPAEPPRLVLPMLATLADKPFDHADWIFEPKFDGYRALAEVERGQVNLYSRRGNAYQETYSEIAESLANLQFDVVLDGEIAVLDEHHMAHFNLLQRYKKDRKGQIHYFVFDLLYLGGQNLMGRPLLERKQELQRILINLPHVSFCEHRQHTGREFFREMVSQGLEGVIAKRAHSFYWPGVRSEDWLKFKAKKSQEVIIGGYTEAKDNRPIGALLIGLYQEGKLVFAGHCGTGFDVAEQERLYTLFQGLIQKNSPFSEPVKANAPVTWLRPELICEVEFQNWTRDGRMRIPSYKGLRDDKTPEVVAREKPIHGPDLPSTKEEDMKKEDVKVEGKALVIGTQRVEISNLDKVYWPDEGYTKFDLLQYYIEVSDTILPYLLERPESLHRHPDGIMEKGFYQKDFTGDTPEWVETIVITSESQQKDIRYLVCQNTATLLFMANLGCIEINPWNARLDQLEYPDYLILDLDPGDKTRFEDVVETALVLKSILDTAELPAFCKTSGSRGLHVCLPLGRKYTHEQSRDFAKAVALLVEQRLPRLTSLKRSPKERRDRIYLDYLQNKIGATLVAPYSVRPRPGATVSAPLDWEELRPGLHPSQFTIRNLPARLQQKGDLWKPVLGEGIDMVAALERLGGNSP